MAISKTLILASVLLSTAWGVFTPEDRTNADREYDIKNLCSANCFCSTRTIRCEFYADSKNGTIFRVTDKTRTLSLHRWPANTANDAFFQRASELGWLRLSGGNLLTFPSVKKLTRLTYLDVSDNVIQTLSPLTFPDGSQVTQLNISGNNLKNISARFFSQLSNLRMLDLSRNPFLLQIPANSFSSAGRKLRYLDISFTGLREIGVDWTSSLQQLILFNISNNDLHSVPQLSLSSLEILDASHNYMTTLPKLAGLVNLRELYLAHTYICYLNADETKGCNKLQIIDISYANLTNINENVLSNCKHFREINLSHNYQLFRIEHGALSGLENLAVLKLNDCPKLNNLEDDMFNGLKNLNELHLQHSGISVLPTSLGTLHNLTYVNLEETNLLCNCYAHWLPQLRNSTTNVLSWRGINPIQCQDGKPRNLSELQHHLEELECKKVYSYTEQNRWTLAPWGQSALLDCNVTGNPQPEIVWQTVDYRLLVHNKSIIDNHPWVNHQITKVISVANAPIEGKFRVLQTGQLLIRELKREDIGRYKCFAFNAVSNTTVVSFLGIQDTEFRSMVLESILFGFSCAALFLFVTLLTQFIRFVLERLGWECCCCCEERLSPKAKQIRKLIESVESYKSAQLDRLKDNYNFQVVSIKDSCYSQMERLRDSYSQQSKNLKELRDYSTQHLTGARDQYLDQVNKVRDYSMGQMNRVRENYVFQRHKIRKFSGHQLLRLRDTYKYQQKTLNKLLETLPDLYIQNCRTGSCQRTDSMIFEDEIDGLDIYYKFDFLDTQSNNSSNFYTPSSTLPRQSKGNKGKENKNSSNGSSISSGTEYQEAHSWIHRQDSNKSEKTVPIHKRFHTRSFSIAVAPSVVGIQRPSPEESKPNRVKGHQRSISASSHPSPRTFSPKPSLLEGTVDTSPRPPDEETPLKTRVNLVQKSGDSAAESTQML